MSQRPVIPIEVRRQVLFEARHHCAVCCEALPLEYAHIIPWRTTQDHSVKNLIALCVKCHRRADGEKWGESYLRRYKQSPCIVARATHLPLSAEQKALVDLIVACDPDMMTKRQRQRLVSMVAAYASVPLAHIQVESVAPANSARVRLSLPDNAARRLLDGFTEKDPTLKAFLDDIEVLAMNPVDSEHIARSLRTRSNDMTLEPNAVLRGENAEYAISKLIGQGAHGQAYLAVVVKLLPDCHRRVKRALNPGDPVVLKAPPVLTDKYSLQERREFLRRLQGAFSKEYCTFDRLADVKSAAHIYDIGIVKVPIGESLEPSFFVVYEHIKGVRLDDYLERMPKAEGRCGVQGAAVFFDLARQLTEALTEIHQAGVVHGDVWPKNIMLNQADKPVYIDFGQAVVRREVELAEQAEESHPYLPPEDERSVQGDVYSLCGTLFFLATGHVPPESDPDIDIVKDRVVSELREHNRQLYEESSGVADIIARGLRGPERRTADCGRLLEDIELFDTRQSDSGIRPEELLTEIQGMLPRLCRKEPLFGRMVARRIRRLRRYVEEMLDGMYDVHGDHNEIVMMCSEYMSMFEPGDEYLTVTLPWFWFRDNIGKKGRFFSVNKEVIKRGARVRRIFFLTKAEQREQDIVDILQAHAGMLDEIDSEATADPINTTEKALEAGGVFTGVQVGDEAKRQRIIQEWAHGGVWIRGERVKLALPVYDEDRRRLIAVHLRPGDVGAQRLKEDFYRRYLAEAVELRYFLREQAGS